MNSSARLSRSSVLIPGLADRRMSSRVSPTMCPARAIVSSSRGDLMVIMANPLAANDALHPVGDFVHLPHRRNQVHRTASLEPLQHRRGLLAIGLEPDSHCRRIAVRPPLDPPPLVDPGEDFRVRHIEEEHAIHPAAPLSEQTGYAIGLGNGADYTVENDSLGGLRL